MRHVAVFVFAWLTLPSGAAALDIYVNNVAGDDRFDGTAPVSQARSDGALPDAGPRAGAGRQG